MMEYRQESRQPGLIAVQGASYAHRDSEMPQLVRSYPDDEMPQLLRGNSEEAMLHPVPRHHPDHEMPMTIAQSNPDSSMPQAMTVGSHIPLQSSSARTDIYAGLVDREKQEDLPPAYSTHANTITLPAWMGRRPVWLTGKRLCALTVLILVIVAAIAIPLGIIEHRKNTTTTAAAAVPTATASPIPITANANSKIRAYTDLIAVNASSAANIFYSTPSNEIANLQINTANATDYPTNNPAARNNTPLATAIYGDPSGVPYTYYFYVDTSDTIRCEAVAIATQEVSACIFDTASQGFRVPSGNGPATVGFAAAAGLKFNASAGFGDGGLNLYSCFDGVHLQEAAMATGDEGLVTSFTFPVTDICPFTAVVRLSPGSLLFRRTSSTDDTIELWGRTLPNSIASTNSTIWEQGQASPMTVPQTNYFCAHHELFAFQGADGLLYVAELDVNYSIPQETTWGAVQKISDTPVPMGTALTCEKDAVLRVYYQAADASIAYFQQDNAGASWNQHVLLAS